MSTRPDTALRRSDELLAVGQPAAALSSVSEIFSSKRFRSTPLSSLEPIMLRFLELCVMLRKGRTAKEGLHIYRNVAQNTSVTAVETVIRFFLDKSKEKLDEALAKVDQVAGPATAAAEGSTVTTTQTTKEDGSIATVEVEDLEAAETPESILLSAVSDEKSRDRTYRTLVTPWLRFLWESYRTALDTLRNNARLEVLYQTVALEAFQFCLQHARKTEFRRLAETLRQHFASAQKYSSANYSINISDPETLQRYLDIRFAQLNTAVELELWQEAFRSAEDIHGLVAASKRAPRASMMASFYEKLVKVFAVGQNFLFHAAAYGKLWSLQAGSAGDDRIAGLVLLSALSVPLASGAELKTKKDPITGEEKDYTRGRMTLMGLLDLPTAPSRETLLNDALKRGILKHVSPELKSLYQIIEKDFHPLRITSKLEPIFAHLKSSPETARYIEPLKNVVLSRLFQQLAQVYDSVKLARIVKLATFKDDAETDKSVTQVRVEKFITDACRRGEMSVRLDHAEGIVEFEDRTFGEVSGLENSTQKSSIDILQPTPSTLLRNHLANLAQTLYGSLETISPADMAALAYSGANAESSLQAMAKNMQAEREALLARRLVAEQRKQRAEADLAKKEKEAEAARIAARQQSAANEAKRVEQEAKARQLELIRKNNEAIKQEEARKLADKLKAAGALKVADKEIETMDTAQLRRMQVEQMEKEQKQLSEKLRIISKRIDHTERAFRKEEISLLYKDYELQQKRDRELFDQTRAQRMEDARAAHAHDLDLKKRLLPKMKDFEAFKQKKLASSSAAYEKASKESKAKIAEEKQKRIAEYEAKRAEERERARAEEEARQRAEEEAARAEAEAREREEAERAAREEEEARAAEEKRKQDEEREKRRQELLEQRMKGDEQARKQREREEEAERRAKEREAARKAGAGVGAGAVPARPVVGAGGWRRDAPATAVAGNAANDSAPAAAASGPPKLEGLKSSWRDRQAAAAAGASSGAPAPAASVAAPAPAAASSGERPRFALAPRTQPAPERAASPASSGAAASAAAPGQTMTWREREALKAQQNGTAATDGAAPADDGFQTVKKPSSGAGGAYRPPGARGGADSGSRWR